MFSTLAKLLFHVAISCYVFFSTFPDKMSDKERIKDVCQMISKGAYNMSQANDKTPSRQKGIVDHYHQVVYCDIGKTGSTSWLSLFRSIIKREQQSRQQWYHRHNYTWYNSRELDRYR